MSPPRLPAGTILAAGAGLGIAGDLLLRAPGEPGLNVALLILGVAASVVLVSRHSGGRLERESLAWLATGVLMAGVSLWRGSEFLRVLALLSAALVLTFPAYRGGAAWVRRAGPTEVVESVAASLLHSALGAFRLLAPGGRREEGAASGHRVPPGPLRSVLVGALLAAVPVAVFGALFVSADAVFAGLVRDLVRVELEDVVSHLALVGILGWLAAGYLAGSVTGTRLEFLRGPSGSRSPLGTPAAVTALGLVDLLFVVFVAVQFRSLVGGAAWVEAMPGVTWSEHAREGFFQLVVATALGLPWLLLVDGLHEPRTGGGRRAFQLLAGAQLLLLVAIAVSALRRLGAYLDVYGLTENRVVALAVLVWAVILVVAFGATVLRGRKDSFVAGALGGALAVILVLEVVNPAALSARSQLDRGGSAGTGGAGGPDVAYLASLGSDATPILLDRIHELDAAGRCTVGSALLARWGSARAWDWRSWNLADARARVRVAEAAPALEAMGGGGDGCA